MTALVAPDHGPVGAGRFVSRPGPAGLPRLLPAAGENLVDLASHLERHGPLPLLGAAKRDTHPLIGAIERAGLTGRGGSGFPTARKFAAVARQRGATTVVVNAVEAEPVSAKDKALCTLSPHLVIDGASTAAEAVHAQRIVLVAHASVLPTLIEAVAVRRVSAIDPVPVEVVAAADHFVAGEERALVNWIDNGRSIPTAGPSRPYERGVGGRPTLVNNAETLAHVGLIARYGDAWFRSLGTTSEPGTILVTARGAVRRPGVYEASIGTALTEVIRAAGGSSGTPIAFLVGGYFGTWISQHVDGVAMSRESLAPLGANMGAGLVLVLPDACCGLVETARLARYLAGQSAGQCGPCVFGLRAISDALVSLARREAGPQVIVNLRRWLGEVEGRGACAHPDGVVRLVRSALDVFEGELERHLAGRCGASHPEQSVLALPAMRTV